MKNTKQHLIMVSLLTVFLPLVSLAQTPAYGRICNPQVTDITDILCRLGSIGNLLIPILIILGIVYFMWGVVTYVIGGDEEAKTKGKDRIIYGLIGFVVIFALKGIIALVINTFGIDPGSADYVNNFIQNNSAIAQSNTFTCKLAVNPKLGDLFIYATCLINGTIIPLIFSLAVVMFIWGVVQYVINDSDEGKKDKGREFMVWGIVGLTVMVGIWGIVKMVGGTFGILNVIPQLP